MEAFYFVLFLLQAGVAGYLEYLNRARGESKHSEAPKDFILFRNNYLVVYSLMMAGDWLQGPYVYALYEHYGFDRGDIGRLFIAGFGSSMIFGTIVGSLADKHGRKRAALTYVITYSLGCFSKHFNSFWVLFFGRVLCGISTSLLYSAFESWLVAEHFKRNYVADWLGTTFSQAVFLGNGLMAILSGLFAHSLVETFGLGPVAPFDAAATVMIIGGVIISSTWSENFGDSSGGGETIDVFKKAAKLIASDQKIALLGAMQALFEGSMYTFVFLWTPALSPNQEHIPHGMIFACFMVSSMVGSAFAGKLLSKTSNIKPEKYMQAVFGMAALCLLVPVMYSGSTGPEYNPTGGITLNGKIQLIAFCAFECLVGVFWPSMMTLRSQYVPEEIRSTIINFFRIPLNLFVCVVLYNVSALPLSTMFSMCSFFLLVCLACQKKFSLLVQSKQHGHGHSLHLNDEEQASIEQTKLSSSAE
jgi:MFS family permease